MKHLLFLILSLFASCLLHAQKKFNLISGVGTEAVTVNGSRYLIDSIGVKITTNFPGFDTLRFDIDSPNGYDPIICNFKPDTSYVITGACCATYDILPLSKLNNDSLKYWDFEADFYKIQGQLIDVPFISIKTKGTPRDSIFAWHADAACMTECKAISKKLWRLGYPPKCFYWTNITSIVFFKENKKMPEHTATSLEEFLGRKNIVELEAIDFRLFDKQRFVITFDEKRNTVNLEYE